MKGWSTEYEVNEPQSCVYLLSKHRVDAPWKSWIYWGHYTISREKWLNINGRKWHNYFRPL